jgi:hypothetical protein
MAYHLDNLRITLTWDFWEKLYVSRFPEICTTYGGLILGLIGAFALHEFSTSQRKFLWAWLGATFIYSLFLGRYGRVHQYPLLPFAPVLAVFIALGAGGCLHAARSKPILKPLTFLLLLTIPIHTMIRTRRWYRTHDAYLSQARVEIDRHLKPEDLLVTYTRDLPYYLYHLDRYGFVVETPEDLSQLDAFFQEGARYFFSPTNADWQEDHHWKQFLDQHATLVIENKNYLLYRIDLIPENV